jgi:hypothetical protein
VRVSLLLAALGVVLLWAATDCYQRRARTTWRRPLIVALVLVEREPVEARTMGLFADRVSALERRLASEYKRHDGRDFTPFSFVVKGPLRVEQAPPKVEPSALGLLRYSHALWRWTRALDTRAEIERSAYDARIYLVMKPTSPGSPAFVEGEGEYGGRIGVAEVDIEPDRVDFSLFVAVHELMHTLGASDKYDDSGNALFPDGFAEPAKNPLYPQRGAEIMARDLPLSPVWARPPKTLDELFVGDATAREITRRRGRRRAGGVACHLRVIIQVAREVLVVDARDRDATRGRGAGVLFVVDDAVVGRLAAVLVLFDELLSKRDVVLALHLAGLQV